VADIKTAINIYHCLLAGESRYRGHYRNWSQ